MREKLVLGLGGTVDYEVVWDSAVVEALIAEYAISADELTTAIPIRTERDLVVSIVSFVRDDVGGERFVASSDIIETFAERFEKRITLGGTPVRAALGMAALGIDCTLHLVSIDDHVRRLLPPNAAYLCSATSDSTDPHLIIQFAGGVRIRAGDIDVSSRHPNRIIFTNDPPNRELLLSEELGRALTVAEVFLISGFNVIQDARVLDHRLADLTRHMRQLPDGAIVMYEDAGFHIPALSDRVRDALVDELDVYSMNEDELQVYLGREIDLLDAREVEGALAELRTLLPGPALVIHTKFWSLALADQADRFEPALRGGITMASTRYVHGDGFTEQDYDAVGALEPNALGAVFAEELESRMATIVRCIPALTLEVERPTTIGLGDTFVGGFLAALAGRS